MSLNISSKIPVQGVTIGVTAAKGINYCLTVVDGHNHSLGSGNQITPPAINMDVDFDFNNLGPKRLKSIQFQSQIVVVDEKCAYVKGTNLFYNNSDSDPGGSSYILITFNHQLAPSASADITNLSAPASLAYNSSIGTFIFQDVINSPAYIDCSSITIRNGTPDSYGITLKAIASTATCSITLPALPDSPQKFCLMNTTGAILTSYAVDNTSVEILSSTFQVKDAGVTTAKIADKAVTQAKMGTRTVVTSGSGLAGNIGLVEIANTLSSPNYPTSPVYQDISGGVFTLTTTGRPVFIGVCPKYSASDISYIESIGKQNQDQSYRKFRFTRDGASLGNSYTDYESSVYPTSVTKHFPPGMFCIDPVSAGTYVYKVQYQTWYPGAYLGLINCQLVVYEL